jgi:AraC family transcriptional regulator, transcriptional activator of pobA
VAVIQGSMAGAYPVARDGTGGGMIVVGHQSARNSTGRKRRPVTHTYAALAFFTGGRTRLELNGEWTLRAGDVLLVPPGVPHRMLEREQADVWMLGFCVPCFVSAGASSLLAPFERVRDGAAAVVNIPQERRAFLASLFRELDALKADESQEVVQRSLATLILAEVERATSEGGLRTTRGGGIVVDALRFIERNCLGHITPRDVATAVKRSPAYLTTALKQATGRSAGEWIVAGRMAEARRLLLHSDERIHIVAERVGYADPTHFIRMFRRAHGATPAAWRSAQLLQP